MTIRFTVKTIERLCDVLRSQVDDIRRFEREIRKIVVDRCGMSQDHFEIGRASCRERVLVAV